MFWFIVLCATMSSVAVFAGLEIWDQANRYEK